MVCHISANFKRITNTFTTKSKSEKQSKTIDKEPYLLGSKRNYLFERAGIFRDNDNFFRDRELRNQFRNAVHYIRSKYSHLDIFNRFAFYGNLQEYDFLRFYIARRLVNVYSANEKVLNVIYDKRYHKYIQGFAPNLISVYDVISDEFYKQFYYKKSNIDRFIDDYINNSPHKIDLSNPRELSHFTSATAFAVYTAIIPAPSNYVYSFYDKIESDMKMERIYNNPLTWGAVALNEYAYEKTVSLENILRTTTYDNISLAIKEAAIQKNLESMDLASLTFSKIMEKAKDMVLSGELSLNIAAEVGSTVATQVALQSVGRTILALASFIPWVRGFRMASAVGEFLLKSFAANFTIQVYLEWELDGYIQEKLRPLLSILEYNQYKQEMKSIQIKQDYKDLYMALLDEKGIFKYIYGNNLKAPKLNDVIARIRNREYYTEETLQNMIFHLNISAIKLQAKLFAAKKRYEEAKKRYKEFKERMKELYKLANDDLHINAEVDTVEAIQKVNSVIDKLKDFPFRLNPSVSKSSNSIIVKQNNSDKLCSEVGSLPPICPPPEKNNDKDKYYIRTYKILDFYKSEYIKTIDDYSKTIDYSIYDAIECNSCVGNISFINFSARQYDYISKSYNYYEYYDYTDIFYRLLKSLIFDKHLIRRINIRDKYVIIHFDSAHKTYIYYSDKMADCFFYATENDVFQFANTDELTIGYSVKDDKGFHRYIYKDFYNPSSKSKQVSGSLYVSNNIAYIYLYRSYYVSSSKRSYIGTTSKYSVFIENSQSYYDNYYYEVYQEIRFAFDIKNKKLVPIIDWSSYNPATGSYNKVEYIIKSYIRTKDKEGNEYIKDVPIELVNPFTDKKTNPFILSSYVNNLSRISPINPDNPSNEILNNSISLKDFASSLNFEYLPQGLTEALTEYILNEFATLKFHYNYDETYIYNFLSPLSDTLPLPFNVSYSLVSSVYNKLIEYRDRNINIESYNF
jgi:hypothetical protein